MRLSRCLLRRSGVVFSAVALLILARLPVSPVAWARADSPDSALEAVGKLAFEARVRSFEPRATDETQAYWWIRRVSAVVLGDGRPDSRPEWSFPTASLPPTLAQAEPSPDRPSPDESPKKSVSLPALFRELSLDEPAYAMAVHPKKSKLATISQRGVVTVWDTKKWKVDQTFPGPAATKGALAFSPNGKWLAAGGESKIRVWSTSRWKPVAEVPLRVDGKVVDADDDEDHPDEITVLRFSPNSQFLYAGGDSRSVMAWKVKRWRAAGVVATHQPMKHKGNQLEVPKGQLPPGVVFSASVGCQVNVLEFARKGRILVTGGRTHAVRLWKRVKNTWTVLHEFEEQLDSEFPAECLDARVSSDGKTVALSYGNSRLLVVDTKSGKALHDISATSGFLPTVEFSEDGKLLYTGGDALMVLSCEGGKQLGLLPLPAVARVVRLTQDGRYLVATCEDSKLRIYDLKADSDQ